MPLLLTGTEGIYLNRSDPSTLVRDVLCDDLPALRARVGELMTHCDGASRAGAGGAKAKLEYALRAAEHGSRVIIGHARHHVSALVGGAVPCTQIGLRRG